jgi:hypothetical protein
LMCMGSVWLGLAVSNRPAVSGTPG